MTYPPDFYIIRSNMNDFIPSPLNAEPAASPTPKCFWSAWATAGLGAVILFALFLVTLVVVVIMSFAIGLFQMDTPFNIEGFINAIYAHVGLLTAVSGIVAYTVAGVLTIAFIKARRGASIAKYLGLRRITWKAMLLLVLITAIFVTLVTLIGSFFQADESDTKNLVEIYNTSTWPVLLWIAVVVFAPIIEELIFRGFLFEGFRNSRIGLIGAILLTSIVFTILHIGYSVSSLGAVFVFGLILGTVRHKTGSLWSTILMHALYNAVGMSLITLNVG